MASSKKFLWNAYWSLEKWLSLTLWSYDFFNLIILNSTSYSKVLFLKFLARARRGRRMNFCIANRLANFPEILFASCARTRWPWAAAARVCGCGAGPGSRWLADAFANAFYRVIAARFAFDASTIRVRRLCETFYAFCIVWLRFIDLKIYFLPLESLLVLWKNFWVILSVFD